jgi:hypothetical protein
MPIDRKEKGLRPRKLNVGDSITFKAATRSDCKLATRKVVGIDEFGRPMVRYHGWSNFVVAWHEIKAIAKANGA